MDKSPTTMKLILSSFQGCFLGGLLGDILGRPFESARGCDSSTVQKYFDDIHFKRDGTAVKMYSDDTVMTLDLAESLVAHPRFSAMDMAQRFAKSCISSFVDRYYGGTITQVFEKWMASDFLNVWTPAREQFKGSGSFGNGAAMRISPVGLISARSKGTPGLFQVTELAIKTSQLTHTHPLGVGGAIFQSIAITNALRARVEVETAAKEGCSGDVEKVILDGVEKDLVFLKEIYFSQRYEKSPTFTNQISDEMDLYIAPYLEKISTVRDLLGDFGQGQPDLGQLRKRLGNGVAAIDSVPTALYCFLRGFNKIPGVEADSHYQRSVQLAISLGGDTDTIASMAGSLVGTFLGVEKIPISLQNNCEGVQEIASLAEKFYQIHYIDFGNNKKCKM